uniref:Ig-like domain-containing protein n=1 Tax=Oncorhynchus kisutch TaxID=8019 RepID=A0A8C7F231_ONCKI
QSTPMMVAELGGSVTLTCFCPNVSVTRFHWFKQSFGQKPIHMTSSFYGGHYYSINFIKDFTETKRLGVRRGDYSCNLTISKTEPGDSATYFCSTTVIYEQTYGEGTVLIVKDSESNIMSVLQQPVSESVQPGDFVTLNCTIHTETCAGEHSVYWFRHGSEESRPGIIYSHGNRSDQCEKSPEAGSPTQSCVYNLPKRNLTPSDAGTYYCAVASCGKILFGNGTKLDIQGSQQRDVHRYLHSVVCCEHKTSPSLRFGQACWPFAHSVPLCGFQQDVYVVSLCFLSFLNVVHNHDNKQHSPLIYCMPNRFTGKDIATSKIAPKSTIYQIIKNFRAPKKVRQAPGPSSKVDSAARSGHHQYRACSGMAAGRCE